MCPDPEAVRFLITGMQGAKCTVEPAEPVLAKKKEKEAVSVKIEDGGGLLSLKIDFSLTNDFQLTASPYIKLSSEASKPDKFVRRHVREQPQGGASPKRAIQATGRVHREVLEEQRQRRGAGQAASSCLRVGRQTRKRSCKT